MGTPLVSAAVLSNRYMSDRFLPDKAIDLVDEAAARLRMESDSSPREIDECERRLMRLQSLDGNVAGALRTYHNCASLLQRELGVEPGAATRESYERLLHLQAPADPLPPTRLPLIGRQGAWEKMLAAWRESRRGGAKFVLLSGEAGIAVQQIIVVCQFETAGTPDREIGFDGLSHRSTSGQGCATGLSRAVSTLA